MQSASNCNTSDQVVVVSLDDDDDDEFVVVAMEPMEIKCSMESASHTSRLLLV